MDQITIGLKKDEKSFSVVIRPFDNYNLAFYKIKNGDFINEIRFSSPKNYYAMVYYKNLIFHGRILSRNEWRIHDNKFDNIVYKKNNMLYIKNNKVIDSDSKEKEEKRFPGGFDLSDYKYIKPLYDSVVLKYNDLYENIEDKYEFESQLFEYLYENGDFNIDDEGKIIGYNDSEYEDENNCHQETTKECKEFMERFINGENDKKILDQIITLNNLVKHEPMLKTIDREKLNKLFEDWLNENIEEQDCKDIYYDREDMLYSIALELLENYNEIKRKCFEDNIVNHLERIFGKELEGIEDLYTLGRLIICEFRGNDIPSDKMIKEVAQQYINNIREFNSYRDELLNTFNTDEIILELNEDKILKFQNHEKFKCELSGLEEKEYNLIYIPVVESYKRYCCKKNSNKPKPIIEGFNDFMIYVENIYNILINNNYLILHDDSFDVNFDVDVSEIIKAVSILEKATCEKNNI